MPWLQLSVSAGDIDPEALSAFFERHAAISITYADAADQPLFEPAPGTTPLWSQTRVTALFAQSADLAALRQAMEQAFGAQVLDRLSEGILEDQDWERVWLDRFHPMRFGNRLWVCPGGQTPPSDSEVVSVALDPGLAFGTGTHATTALCLEWLDANPPEGRVVLDYGCGSGILAIAALKLGATHAWAVDIDAQALWSTRRNAERNGVAAHLDTAYPGELPTRRYDVVLANIVANPLIELAPELARLVMVGGNLVLSGVLENQVTAVCEAYAPWFRLGEAQTREGWVRLHGMREG
jgi:ribosomal protein L11 methyltransferase